MKYIDLHLHLDGSISKDIAIELSKQQNIVLPNNLDDALSVDNNCKDLNEYLQKFALPLSLLQSEWAIEKAFELVQTKLKSQGVVYAEIRFAPQLHTQKGLSQRQVIESALKGLGKCDLDCNIILCLMRSDNNLSQNEETVRLCKEFIVQDGGVVALDLAGAEKLFPTKDFKSVFRLAKDMNIPFTIHAGEADDYKSVEKAIAFGAKRIGHGVNARQSENLLQIIKDKNIGIEMCPTSNLQTKAVASFDEYPLRDYLERGILVTINTDNPTVSNTTIQKEFEIVKKMGFSQSEINAIKLNAIEIAFCSDDTKNRLRKMIF